MKFEFYLLSEFLKDCGCNPKCTYLGLSPTKNNGTCFCVNLHGLALYIFVIMSYVPIFLQFQIKVFKSSDSSTFLSCPMSKSTG